MGRPLKIVSLTNRYIKESPSATQRQLAEMEDDVWAEAKAKGAKEPRQAWLRSNLGVSHHESQTRLSLLRMGTLAEPLWTALDSNVFTVKEVEQIVRKSRLATKTHRTPSSEAIKNEMANALNGTEQKIVKKTGGKIRTRQLKQEIETAIKAYALWKVEDISETEMELVMRRFMLDMAISIRDLQVHLGTLKDQRMADTASELGASYEQLKAACGLLGIECPGRGQRVDLKAANAKKRQAARRLHPDVSAADTRKEFEAIMAAYDVVMKYDDLLAAIESRESSQ